jgi:rhodanese-related sulfurtransferase
MQDITLFVQNHLSLAIALGIVILLLVIVELVRAKRNTFNVSPTQAIQLINHQDGVIIDLRAQEAYQKGHIVNAVSVPLAQLKDSTKKLEKYKTRPLIFICGAGIESQKMAASLLKQGYNAYSLAGGMRAWLGADLPIVKE